MSKSILQLDREFLAIMNAIEDFDGEPPDWLVADLERIEGELVDKAFGYISIYRQFELDQLAHEEQRNYHASQLARLEKRKQWLAGRIEAAMRIRKIDKLKTVVGTAALRTGHDKMRAVDVVDLTLVPKKYMVTPLPPPPHADKKAIQAAILAGEKVPGAVLKPNPEWLEIRTKVPKKEQEQP